LAEARPFQNVLALAMAAAYQSGKYHFRRHTARGFNFPDQCTEFVHSCSQLQDDHVACLPVIPILSFDVATVFLAGLQ
jgi:hypothetical protein